MTALQHNLDAQPMPSGFSFSGGRRGPTPAKRTPGPQGQVRFRAGTRNLQEKTSKN
jgi:hypothetical protein